ncbi:SUMF1/EgtB/PvdO family nonheme iron enzyme [Schlesneria paludicola]|uniref:SUMF1/EgtB/PvdO family nonheme iron enzyme n=1 Tax=Schlesneria paludicola TaxID=360056 RepID=UPI0012F82CF2|nr:SUMF1/EgtB/PvdO family nonheme iron enzyme [Schlesneria paludicola]
MKMLTTIAALFLCVGPICAQEPKPQKYALLDAVREYDHPDMNQTPIQYPEVDAKSMNDLLKEAGYEVDLLLGKQATQDIIRNKLATFATKGGNKGVVVVGLFGHGIEFDSTKTSYFCPYDTVVKSKRDKKGLPISDDNGKARMEPDADTMIAIEDVLLALRESKATNRILFADCCRSDPNAARGRSFGTSLETNQLPTNTAVLFACSASEKAYEHPEWGHGAFTKCLLDAIRQNASHGKSLVAFVAADVEEAVEQLVRDKVRASQTPRSISTGGRVDLKLTSLSPSKPRTEKPGEPEEAKLSESAKPQQRMNTIEAVYTRTQRFDGLKAGDRKELMKGYFFRWCPAGVFIMGSPKSEKWHDDNENEVSVTLTKGYWMCETEVTQKQWLTLMGTKPWIGRTDCAASYITYLEAVSFCEKLTRREHSSGQLPNEWKYSLPSEAQWEYACRAEMRTAYSYGDDESQLSEYGWVSEERYVHVVGQKKPNDWGLNDMHGNVSEWCSYLYRSRLSGGRDPVGSSTGSEHVIRGGSWYSGDRFSRSGCRSKRSPEDRDSGIGFRLAAVVLAVK